MNTERTGGAVQEFKRLSIATVTKASQVMLPVYPVMCFVLAANYITDAPRLMASPALSSADKLLPLPVWGAMFAFAGAVLLVGLVIGHRVIYLAGLVITCAAMLVWAAVFGHAILDNASFSAPAWPAFACAACWASIRSLTTRESS